MLEISDFDINYYLFYSFNVLDWISRNYPVSQDILIENTTPYMESLYGQNCNDNHKLSLLRISANRQQFFPTRVNQ